MSKQGNHLTRREFLRMASLAAGGVLLSSCAPGATTPAPGGETVATEAVTGPKIGGTMTIGATAGIPQLDPHIVTYANERLYFPGLYNGITEYTPSMEPAPCLAESWDVSEDALTYTWHLRKGVKFHNGRELEGEDIKWNFERCLDEELGSQLRQNIQEVETIEVVDKYTVKMYLNTPSVILPMGAQELKIIAKECLEEINTAPVGTGPYKYKDFIPDETLTLERYDDYWGGKPYLDVVIITAIKDSTAALTALKTGQWDFFRGISTPDGASLQGDPNLVIVEPPISSSNMFWELDVTSPPFDNKIARQALSYAVDRQKIVDGPNFGYGRTSVTNNFIAEDHWAFNPNLTKYTYDLAKAKEMFDQAGIGPDTKLTWWTIAGSWPEWVQIGEILVESLKEIGLNMDIQQNEVGAWVEPFYPSGKQYPGLVIPNGDTAALDPAYPLKFFASGRCECNYNDPRIDELLAIGKSTLDKEKRKEAYQEIQAIVNDQVQVIVPCSWVLLNAAQKHVEGAWVESGSQLHYESAWLNK